MKKTTGIAAILFFVMCIVSNGVGNMIGVGDPSVAISWIQFVTWVVIMISGGMSALLGFKWLLPPGIFLRIADNCAAKLLNKDSREKASFMDSKRQSNERRRTNP